MILGMDAPTLVQIIRRSRPDVTPNRLSSIYYWLSQNISLRLFRWCREKRVLYVHPSMQRRLLDLGFREHEIAFVSNGMDLRTADSVPPQAKEFDAIWIGRLHFQKGIDDLLGAIQYLREKIPDFRIVLVGRLESELKPRLIELGAADCVIWAGVVSEAEKFRLFKASRVFLIPSRYESWGIVIAEALVCGTPVVGYDLAAYRPIFGNLITYVPCFDSGQFREIVYQTIRSARKNAESSRAESLSRFREDASWEAAGARFLRALASF